LHRSDRFERHLYSIGLSIIAVKTSNRVLKVVSILAAILLGLLNLGLYEATIGLEVLRWVLIWMVLRQNQPLPASPENSRKNTINLANIRPFAFALAPYLLMLRVSYIGACSYLPASAAPPAWECC